MTLTYPTKAEVVAADRKQLLAWWNELKDPHTDYECRVLDLIVKKLNALGVSLTYPKEEGRKHGRM